MLFSICGKKSLRRNNIGGAILLGVEDGDGWLVTGTRYAREDWNPCVGESNMFGLVYTPSSTRR